jgi:N-acetylmuramoyl-L-alanine amidase
LIINRKKINCIFFFLFFSLAVLLISDSSHAANRLYDLRHWSAPTHTRIVFDLKHSAKYNSFVLSNPARLVLDLKDFDGHIPKNLAKINNNIVKTIRLAKKSKNVIRIVIDLKKSSDYKIFPLKKIDKKPPRLVIDITRPDLVKTNRKKREATKNLKKTGNYIVVIDPGHGGEDPGAVNRKGVKEKDIVLKISKTTVKMLNRQKGIKAYLTRKGDYFIPLQKRVLIAKQYGADIFISIHADSSFSTKAYGTSVYCLSFKGASSNTARMVARKENASDFVGGVPLDHNNSSLNKIIIDLVQTHSLNSSLTLAGTMLKEISKLNRLHKKTPPQANFAVLRAPDIPSILIETDFISNHKRAKRMQTPSFQAAFSKCITSAVVKFIKKTGLQPSGIKTSVASRTKYQPGLHRVKRGETLSGIAKKYRVSVLSLKKANRLSSKSILRIGQRLKIPQKSYLTKYHIVKRGETLSGIASKYNVSINSLMKLNRMSPKTTLKIGTRLKLKPEQKPATKQIISYHTVKKGETLSRIALKYNSTVQRLRNLNNMTSKATLKTGTKLIVRTDKKPRRKLFSRYHTVRKGETLSGIALKYNSTVQRLRNLNNMTSKATLKTGTKLIVRTDKKPRRKLFSGYHTVTKGETLSGIAVQYNTTVSRLRELNAFSPRKTLNAGTKVRVSSSVKPTRKYHIIKKGETLSGIASKYSTTIRRLRSLNKMTSKTTLKANKKMRVL